MQFYSLRRRRTRARYSSRPFFVSTLLITLIAAVALLVHRSDNGALRSHYGFGSAMTMTVLAPRADEDMPPPPPECREVHQAADQCAFVRAYCLDDEAGLLPYLTFYYCALGSARPVAFAVLAGWLGMLFTTIGIAASDFFSVNLSTIASVLGLSESLAGVTFLAFGNGSPDVFSTFAAMGSNSGSMAVGELIGAASFITAVVAGSMALVREFKVSRRTFVRDICFFIAAVAFAIGFLADGTLQLWECCVMIGYYLFYVVAVVGWHWVSTRRRRRRLRDAASRSHFYTPVGPGPEELVPYADGVADDDEDAADAAPIGAGRRASSEPDADIGALERGPRIEINDGEDGSGGDGGVAAPISPVEDVDRDGSGNEDEDRDLDEEEVDERGMHLAAEMTSSMRVNRPRWHRSNTTITPIRPSLVGALEFRSVLSSLNKERNMHLRVLPGRTRASLDNRSRSSLEQHQHQHHHHPRSAVSHNDVPDLIDLSSEPSGVHASRDRALSAGDAPRNLDAGELQRPGEPLASTSQQPLSVPSMATTTSDGKLAPPSPSLVVPSPDPRHLAPLRSPDLHPSTSGGSSPMLSPFPDLCESPGSISPLLDGQQSILTRTSASERRRDTATHTFTIPEEHRKPIRWWPYRLLPAPHVVLGTLFPTLQGWREKSVWDKIVSVVSAPSVFLLVSTLPVVETERRDNDCDDDDGHDEGDLEVGIVDAPSIGEMGNTAPPISTVEDTAGQIQPETEWQEYRRRTRSSTASKSHMTSSPGLTPIEGVPLPLPPLELAVASEEAPTSSSMRVVNTANATLSPLPAPALALTAPPPPATTIMTAATATLPRRATMKKSTSSLVNTDRTTEDEDEVAAEEEEVAAEEAGWNRWLVALQIFTGPFFVVFIAWAGMAPDLERPGRTLARWVLGSLAFSLCLLALLLVTTTAARRPRYHFLLCFLGFVISVAWISTVAGEVVGVLKALGVVLGISEAILGLTVFAVGNSLGDLVADVTVARLGYPVMALAACFGGPMLNILLGVGIGGAWMTISSANARHAQDPTIPIHYEPYVIGVGGTLVVSAATVLLTLVVLLIAVPANRWVMTRRIGWGLIAIWSVSTAVNLVLELTGVLGQGRVKL